MQTLKSAQVARVSIGKSQNGGLHRENLGEGLFCPASAQVIANDVYGRPASQNTLGFSEGGFFTQEPACPQYTNYSCRNMLSFENAQRPYLGIAAAGMRGASDMMGVGRQNIPQNLFGEGHRGDNIRNYPTPNNYPPDAAMVPHNVYYRQKVQPYTYSMDETFHNYRQ